jgi:hypothetical protein
MLAFLVGGCAPSQAEIEKSIRDEMKSSMQLEIKSIDIKKQDDGSYLGTATAENGDTYDVTTEKPDQGKIAWKATPSKTTLERMMGDIVTNQLKLKVKTLRLDKKVGLNYSGQAETHEGVKVTLTADWDGKQYNLKAVQAAP